MRMPELLFNSGSLRDTLEAQKAKLGTATDALSPQQVSAETQEATVTELVRRFTLTPPQLQEDGISYSQKESNVSRGDGFGRTYIAQGSIVTFTVPFTGDGALFRLQPSSYSFNPPRGEVQGRELRIIYPVATESADEVRRAFNQDLANVRKWLEWVTADLATFNASLEQEVRRRVEGRKARLERDRQFGDDLGFPRREG